MTIRKSKGSNNSHFERSREVSLSGAEKSHGCGDFSTLVEMDKGGVETTVVQSKWTKGLAQVVALCNRWQVLVTGGWGVF